MNNAELLHNLSRPFPEQYAKTLPKGGGMQYIPWQLLFAKLVSNLGFAWDREVIDSQLQVVQGVELEFRGRPKTFPLYFVGSAVVRLTLHLPDGTTCVRDGSGADEGDDASKVIKTAESDAFGKACMSVFGAGIQFTDHSSAFETAIKSYVEKHNETELVEDAPAQLAA
jgi:hypothetical protein